MEQVGHSGSGMTRAGAWPHPFAGKGQPPVCPLPGIAAPAAGESEWQAIASAAADPNIFAEPWMVAAGLMCNEGKPPQLMIVRGADGEAIGAAMIQAAGHYGRLAIPHLRLWSHPNCFGATVCAPHGREAEMWRALIPALAQGQRSALLLSLPGIVEHSALHRGLAEAASALGLALRTESRVTRALLQTDLDPDTYWEQAVRAKKRKELRRQWARLGEEGELTVDRLAPGTDIAPWTEEFLALEAAGWKGANGSALASAPATERFFREAMAAAHARNAVAITALRLNGRAIAMLVTLLSGQGGFSFKTAFDEAYARYSPGVLLQRESLSLLAGHRLRWIDSCAAQDHPMIDSLWTGRRTVLTLALPLPGIRNRIAFDALHAATRLWHGIKPKQPREAGRSPA